MASDHCVHHLPPITSVDFTSGGHQYTAEEVARIRAAVMDDNAPKAVTHYLHPGDSFTVTRTDEHRFDYWVDDYRFPEGDYLLQIGKPGSPRTIIPAPGGEGDVPVMLHVPDIGEAVAAEAELLASDAAKPASE